MTVNAIELELRVRALARTYPDRVYIHTDQGCNYRPDDENPLGCIVGAAVAPLGADLCEWDEVGGLKGGQDGGDDRIDGNSRWLALVQHHQDRGHTWAEAVALADDGRKWRAAR